jgi:hypothetical protein
MTSRTSGADHVFEAEADLARAPGRNLWFLLLRRSNGIPDAVTPHSARAALVGRLAAKLDQQGDEGTPSDATRRAADRLMEAILELGSEGALDDCLVPTGAMASDVNKARQLRDNAAGRVAERASFEARAKEGWDEIQDLLDRAGAYAREELAQSLRA